MSPVLSPQSSARPPATAAPLGLLFARTRCICTVCSNLGRGGRMHLDYTREQERLRQELRAYFAELMTPKIRESLASAAGEYGSGRSSREVVRQLGADGWL